MYILPDVGLDVAVEVGLLGMKLCDTYKFFLQNFSKNWL